MAKEADKATALWVLKSLRRAGHQALLAGGSVRDMLLGQRCHDYDVATSATPQQVQKIFRRVLMIGAKFGVAMVVKSGRVVEVATFRSDLSYTDGRRPDGVKFSSPKEDALRRDFTINGMFYDPIADEVIDYVSGQADLRAGIVRTIGKPNERFAEDYLRMMRAVRFAVRLNFKIEPATSRAIRQCAPKITQISGERIFDELQKIFSTRGAWAGLTLLAELGLAEHVLPELFNSENNDSQTGWADGLRRLEALAESCDVTLSFGAMLMDLPAVTISRIVRRWGQSNELKTALKFFAEHRDAWQEAADCCLCDFKRLLADANWTRLKKLWAVRERLATGDTHQSRRIARRAGGLAPEQISPQPFVTGDDLLKMSLSEGPKLGRIIKQLYDAQLDETITTRKQALAEARKLVAEIG